MDMSVAPSAHPTRWHGHTLLFEWNDAASELHIEVRDSTIPERVCGYANGYVAEHHDPDT